MAERSTVEGAVQSLIFQNEDNGYTVLSLLTDDGELVTVVGCIPCAAPGEGMTVTGVWTNHPSYGPQFAAESVERRMPETEEDIAAYLASGILKGIGPATAQRLVDRFGADTLAVIEEEPERLQTVKGITAKKAMELSAAFRELTGLKRVMEFLARYELPVPLAMQLYRAYGAQALPRLKEDPYLLTGQAYGVAFSTMDEIALSMGFDGDSPCRVEAALTYELSHNLNNGHVFLPRDKLLFASAQLIDGDPDALETALDGLLARGVIVQEPVAGVQACYLQRLYQAETQVARRLLSLRDAPRQTGKNVDKIIAEMEARQGIAYAPQQRRAVELAARSGVLLLTGGPGTGKTTLASALAKSLDCSFNRIQFTPDVVPSDVTGFTMVNFKTGEMEFHPGAIMCQIALADEINRTSPKTQSALLEVMEEYQVTVDGVTHPMPKPFMVLATQNPSEFVGTYPLPEAQMDRFFLRVSMGYPTLEEEMAVLERFSGTVKPQASLTPVCSARDVIAMQDMVGTVY